MDSFSKNRTFNGLLWNYMLLIGSFLYGSHVVLLNKCKVQGKIPFNSAAVVCFTELAKLLLSVLMLLPQLRKDSKYVLMLPSPKQFMMFSVPAVLYTMNNNLVVHIQAYIDPASFQVLSNLKIVTTVFGYRIILRRPISTNKWIAFALITLAGAFNSYGGWLSSQPSSYHSEMKIHVTLTGIVLILLFCCISGTAGVYTEYILKKQAKLPLAVQGIMLYAFGFGINFIVFFCSQIYNTKHGKLDSKTGGGILQGFSIWTLLIIGSQALNGIISGAIMKNASSLTRLVMIAGAMFVSTSLSVVIFSLQFNAYFITAFILVIVAIIIYHKPDR